MNAEMENVFHEAKGWTRFVRDAVLHPIPSGGVIATVAAVALVVWWSSRSPSEQAPRRWEGGGAAIETDLFHGLVKPAAAGPDPSGPDESIPAKPADWSQPHVSVYSVPAPAAPHPHRTLRDLGDHGQAHAIDFLAKDSSAEPHSWKQLQEALSDGSVSSAGEKDPFRFDRILVATVAKGADWNPGDRMMWTRVFVQPINFSFAGYTVAATENDSVKVTSVEATNTRKVSADIGLTIPGVEGPKASFGPSGERTVKTTSEINAQYEKLGIDIVPNFLRIIRESETGGDVVGNTMVSLSMITDPWNIRRLAPREKKDAVEARAAKVKEHEARESDELRLLVTGVHIAEDSDSDKAKDPITVMPEAPIPHCPLIARIWMLYEQRLINNGRQFYDEGHQDVTFLRAAEEKRDVEMVAADDVSPAVWSIKILHGEGKTAGPEFVKAHIEENGPWRELVFTDYSLAVRAIHWFRTQSENYNGNGKLKFNYLDKVNKIKHANRNDEKLAVLPSLVPVKRTQNECAKDYNPSNRGYESLATD